MLNPILAITTILLYALAAVLQAVNLYRTKTSNKFWILVIAFAAIVLHAILLHHWIDTQSGQNLSFFNVLSQVAWLIACIIVVVAFIRPIANLGVFVYPFAAISIVFAWIIPGSNIINTTAHWGQLLHILLAFLVISVFVIAAIQALVLAWQDRRLRSHQMTGIVHALPPLETMETLLFQMIQFGFILLSIVLITSCFFFKKIVIPGIMQHAVLALLAWLVFAILLCGRKFLGWRGRTAILCTLSGVVLVILSYWLVLEIF